MQINEIKAKLNSDEYSFLKTDKHLGSNIILLTAGGSHAYGTETENSDLDIRGCAVNSRLGILVSGSFRQFTDMDALVGENFEQFTDVNTDTVIYSFNKFMFLLANCNSNTIEMLGCKPEHYFYLSDIGRELINNSDMFLSKKAINSFGKYAKQQMDGLKQLSTGKMPQADLEEHILHVLSSMEENFAGKYSAYPHDAIKLYIDTAVQKGFDKEIFMDINLHHYPLRDYCHLWNELQTTVKNYAKIGKRNKNAVAHNKIAKHSMHLLRLYMTCIDILEQQEIVTYREKEHDLLMDIRNGKYLGADDKPLPEFFELVSEYEKKLEYAKKNTALPDEPDYKRIMEFTAYVNERVVKGEI